MVLRECFSTIAPAKMNGSEPNLAGGNYVTKGNHRKIWASIAWVTPPGGEAATFFVCSYVASQFDPLRTEKTADFGVELRDPTANLCPSSKMPDFLRVGGGMIEKRWFSRFLGCVCCRSATAYTEHQICTQKAWIISGDVVDVPFGVSDPLRITEPQWGTTKPRKIFDPKICFLWPIRHRNIRLFQRYNYFRNPNHSIHWRC